LIELKNRKPHGEWEKWFKETYDLSPDTALRYMDLAKNWPTIRPLVKENPKLTMNAALLVLKQLKPPRRKAKRKAASPAGELDMEEDDGDSAQPESGADSGAGASGPEFVYAASYVRLVQLFLNTETEPEFDEMIDQLGQQYGLKNRTDVVMECLRRTFNQNRGMDTYRAHRDRHKLRQWFEAALRRCTHAEVVYLFEYGGDLWQEAWEEIRAEIRPLAKFVVPAEERRDAALKDLEKQHLSPTVRQREEDRVNAAFRLELLQGLAKVRQLTFHQKLTVTWLLGVPGVEAFDGLSKRSERAIGQGIDDPRLADLVAHLRTLFLLPPDGKA